MAQRDLHIFYARNYSEKGFFYSLNVKVRGGTLLGESRLSAGLELFRFWNAEVAANFNCQVIVDFIMPRNSTPPVCARVTPPRVATAFAEQCAAMCSEVCQ